MAFTDPIPARTNDPRLSVPPESSTRWSADEVNAFRNLILELQNGVTAALSTAQIYPDTTAGLAGVVEGGYFNVPSAVAGEGLITYRKTDSVAVEQLRSPSAAGLAKIAAPVKSQATNGHLPGGAGSPDGSSVGGGTTISTLVHAYLNSLGCWYAYTETNTAATQESYFRWNAPRTFTQGAWVAVSWFVTADNWDWLTAGRVRASLYGSVSGSQILDIKASYSVVDATTRRFYGVAQLGSTFAAQNLRDIYCDTTAWSGRTAAVRATGYAVAVSEQQIGMVDGWDFDLAKPARVAPAPKSMVANGNLPDGVAPTGSFAGGGASIQACTNAYLNGIGCYFAYTAANLAATQDMYCRAGPTPARDYRQGAWVAVSWLVNADDWDWLAAGRVRAILYAKVSGIQYVDIKGSYVQIDATTRRFYGGAQLGPTFLTNALDYVLLETTGWAGRTAVVRATGYVFALSDQQIGPVEWADFDPYKVANHEGRIGALEGVSLPSCKTMAVNGNLPSGATSTGSWVAGGASIQALVDSFLNPLGVSYAYVESSLAAVEQVYYQFRPVTGRVWKNGAYLSYSFIVIADSWAWLDDAAGRIRVLIYPLGGGGQGQQHAPTTYEAISASMRRYNGTVQLAMNPYGTDLDFVWQSIVVPAGRTTIVKATAFAYALGDTDPGPLDWKDWDPWQVNSHASRINALELVVPTPAQMADPLLLIPSSYHLVQGRPLTLYKHGLSETRERNPYEIEFVGANAGGDQAFIEYVQRQINLDGARLSGNGAVYGRIGDDEDTIFKRPLTFYSSPAAKTGSPKILTIGDSLTYRGTLSRMAAKLTAAGVTPTYIGTVQDVGGVLGEGRPSWEFSDYTRRHLVVNSDGTAPSYPVDAAGGDGIVTTVAQYLALSESLGTSYAARWQYNPFIRPSVGGDPADFSKNGYIFDMRFYLDRFSLADPDIVLVALGTNDTASNPGHSGDATGTPLVNITEGLNIMYTQIRAALPDAHVGIVLNGFPGRALWGKFLPALKYILQTYGGREAENIWLLPVYSAQDTKTLYGITVSATDDLGTQKGALLDWVHTDAIGMAQWAEMTFAFVMNRL